MILITIKKGVHLMDATLYIKMLSDENINNLKKMQYKYSVANVAEFIELLKESVYTKLPLSDFNGKPCVYMKHVLQFQSLPTKLLLMPQNDFYSTEAMEEEVYATLAIESIDSSRESIRKIFKGYAPNGYAENRIYSMKKGLDFISEKTNIITEENIYLLYQTIADFLDEENKLLPGQFYRHDSVYIVGTEIEHTGLNHSQIPEYMEKLLEFIHKDDNIDDLYKAAMIHFYFAYLHPYFDGNGRMARLLHQWYLIQKGYSSAMFVSFSYHIQHTRKKYYRAYKLIEDNAKISGVMDITPFLIYFAENIYNNIKKQGTKKIDQMSIFQSALKDGKITEKEKELWNFVLAHYGEHEFSTKQLEKDFSNAAYATIRSFVLKFTEIGLLTSIQYSNRTKYKLLQ